MSSSSSFSAFASISKRLFARSPVLPLRQQLLLAAASCRSYCTPLSSGNCSEADPEESFPHSDDAAAGNENPQNANPQNANPQRRAIFQRPLENGLDQGVYKAILVGKVGQKPVQKYLRTGHAVVLFSLGTGGIRNNRRPLENEEPRDYANRCSVQWHRVSVYPDRLGNLALKHVKPGSILYVEGNLETKIFTDQVTGLVRRIREIAIRRDGRLLFLENGNTAAEPEVPKNVGYY